MNGMSLLNNSSFDQILTSKADARRWYVAFSGGLDSTVLLHLVNNWCQSHPGAPELHAWHVNHGMQELADQWQSHCASVCAAWGIPLRTDCAAVEESGKGSEAAAREARYAVFQEGLVEGDVLLMAHHLDDQVETFFLRLMRGAGLQGLSAIPAQRLLGACELGRPLLDVSRDSLQAYALDRGLKYVDDPSNRDVSLDRNFLRQQVLPLLGERWSGYRQTVSRSSAHIASALSTLEHNLPHPVTVYSTLGDPGIPMQVLASGARDVAAIRLRSWLRSRGLTMPNRAVVDEFLRQLAEGAEESSPRLHCGNYGLQRYGDAVYQLPAPWKEPPLDRLTLSPGSSHAVDGVGMLSLIPASSDGIVMAEDETLDVVWRRGGERCRPQGRAHSQSLKKLYQAKAVPTWWRERIPLLFMDGEMLAVGDLWFCESTRLARPGEHGATLWQLQWKRNTFTPVD